MHRTSHLTFSCGKSRLHPSEKWILIHWKETWSKAQTGNPLGQVGAFSGPLPLPLLPPLLCPPAALPGLPFQEQKSHLVFVWGQLAGRMYCVVLYVLTVSNHACIEFVHVSPSVIRPARLNLYLSVTSIRIAGKCEKCGNWTHRFFTSRVDLLYSKVCTGCHYNTHCMTSYPGGVVDVWPRCVYDVCLYPYYRLLGGGG